MLWITIPKTASQCVTRHMRSFFPVQFQMPSVVPVLVPPKTRPPQRVIPQQKPTPLEMGQFYHQKRGISSSQFWHQLGIWALIISWHDQYVDCAFSAALSPPTVRIVIGPRFIESLLKTPEFAYIMAIFHSNSSNIGPIAYLKAGGGRAAKAAQSMYWSCQDTIRTHILNGSQCCRDRKMEL